jgi:hypothetical protein
MANDGIHAVTSPQPQDEILMKSMESEAVKQLLTTKFAEPDEQA